MSNYYKVVDITSESIKEFLQYNPDSGVFIWTKRMGARVNYGDMAGHIHKNGYIRIAIRGKLYSAHRLAFLFMEGSLPDDCVDHINHNRADNRWINLRRATYSENGKNQKISSINTSGFTGVHFHKLLNKWQARVMAGDKRITIGSFLKKEDAISAIKSERIIHNYHQNHGSAAQ